MGMWEARDRVQRKGLLGRVGQRSEGENEDPLVVVEDEEKWWKVW